VGGTPVAGHAALYQIETVIEKPTPTWAEEHLVVPGLRAGHYLCLFGMHVLTPGVMEFLGQTIAKAPAAGQGGPILLSPALEKLAQRERYLAMELDGNPLQHRREIWHAHGPVGPGAQRQRSRGDSRPAGRAVGRAMSLAS